MCQQKIVHKVLSRPVDFGIKRSRFFSHMLNAVSKQERVWLVGMVGGVSHFEGSRGRMVYWTPLKHESEGRKEGRGNMEYICLVPPPEQQQMFEPALLEYRVTHRCGSWSVKIYFSVL